MAKGKYKVIYKDAWKMRGENYTGKTHSFEEAQRILKEHEEKYSKYHGKDFKPTLKIVRIMEEKRREKNPINITNEVEKKLKQQLGF